MTNFLWGMSAGAGVFALVTVFIGIWLTSKGVDDASAAHMAEMLEEAQARNMDLHDRLDNMLMSKPHVQTSSSPDRVYYANPREQTHGSERPATGQFDPDDYTDLHDGTKQAKPSKPT